MILLLLKDNIVILEITFLLFSIVTHMTFKLLLFLQGISHHLWSLNSLFFNLCSVSVLTDCSLKAGMKKKTKNQNLPSNHLSQSLQIDTVLELFFRT